MNANLVILMIASCVVIARAQKECDSFSTSVMGFSKTTPAEKAYLKQNCVPAQLVRYMTYIKTSLAAKKINGNAQNYRLYTEQKHEQAAWLASIQEKLRAYFNEVILNHSNQSANYTQMTYPTLGAPLQELLEEVDRDNKNRTQAIIDKSSFLVLFEDCLPWKKINSRTPPERK